MKNPNLKNMFISYVIGLGTVVGLGVLFGASTQAKDTSPATGQKTIPTNDNITGASAGAGSSEGSTPPPQWWNFAY